MVLGFFYKIPRSGRLSYFSMLFLTNAPFGIENILYLIMYINLLYVTYMLPNAPLG